MARKLTGNVDKMAAAVAEVEERKVSAKQDGDSEYATYFDDTFSISVKDTDKKTVYENDSEPYRYPSVDSLANALRLQGAKLDDSQMQFLNEALTGEDTGKAVKGLLEDINGILQAKAKQSAYSKVFNAHKPVSEETIDNAKARMIRDFIRMNPTVSVETAIQTLSQVVPMLSGYTVDEFNANKGRV